VKKDWRGTVAYIRNMQVQVAPDELDMVRFKPTKPILTNPKCYNAIDKTDATDSWESQELYGGEGQSLDCP
jgi:hypothetical protein